MKKAAQPDSRITRDAAPTTRGERGVVEDTSRSEPTGLLSSDELDKLIADEFEQTALPNAPTRNGFHRVWLTSASQYDSLQKRERLGYRPVTRASEPQFDPSNGQRLVGHENYITCNEMVLFEIEEQRYQAIMSYFHHKKPMEEEAAIVNTIKDQAARKDSSGKQLGSSEGDGINELETGVQYAQRQRPVFA